jgi:hypothetical protein
MTKSKNKNKSKKREEIEDFQAVTKMEERSERREQKKRKKMPVSGKGVFKLKELKEKEE